MALDLNETDDDNDSSKRSVAQVDPSDLGMHGMLQMFGVIGWANACFMARSPLANPSARRHGGGEAKWAEGVS